LHGYNSALRLLRRGESLICRHKAWSAKAFALGIWQLFEERKERHVRIAGHQSQMASGSPAEPAISDLAPASIFSMQASKSRCSRTSPEDIEQICRKLLTVVDGDIGDQTMIEKILNEFECTAVIYLASLKWVFDSGKSPLDYYDTNVVGAHRLMWP
jgi:hypothetical protein